MAERVKQITDTSERVKNAKAILVVGGGIVRHCSHPRSTRCYTHDRNETAQTLCHTHDGHAVPVLSRAETVWVAG